MTVIESMLRERLKEQGTPWYLVNPIAARLAPTLTTAIIQHLSGDQPMVTKLGSGVSIAAVQMRIHAQVPAITAGDYGSYSVIQHIISTNPTWTEDQVYAEALKSFLPKSQGGKLLTRQQVATRRAIPTYVLIGGAIVLAYLVLK